MFMDIGAAALRAALADIEVAEANGFMHCLAVMHVTGMDAFGNLQLAYSDLCERAHPTNPALNWGRFQGVTRRNKFINGKLVAIEPRLTTDIVADLKASLDAREGRR